LQVGFILNQSDIFFLELVLNRFGFLLMYRFISSSQFSFEMGSPATTVSIKSLAFIKRKTALVCNSSVQLIRHNKPYFSCLTLLLVSTGLQNQLIHRF
jgi:hypothetical protein